MQDNLVEVIVTKSKQIYPKTIHRDGDFGIVSCKVSSVNIGENILVIHPIYDTITIKGAMCTMKDKKKYKVIGTQSFDPTYKSYSIDIGYIDEYNENINIEDFEGYLKYVMTESEFEKISQLDNLKEVLENKDIDTLVTVKGIGKKKAETIIKKYTSNKQDNIYRAKLAAYGVTEGLMNRLKDKYNSYEAAINKIEENYYLLAEDEIHGLGFKTVDTMALKSGIAETDARRIRGYIVYLLKTGLSEGKSYLPTSFILNSIYNDIFNNEVTITKEELGMIFAGLFAEEIVWRSDDKQRLALVYARKIEYRLAQEIIRLHNAKPPKEKTDWRKVVKKIEKEQGWEYTHQQLYAIEQVMTNNFVLVTGQAGTGKSTVLNPMTNILVESQGKIISQCALSGKAANRIEEVTGYEAKTIHRLLSYSPQKGFAFNAENKLETDIVVLDEASMADASMALKLLEAIKTGTKVILLGDTGQLPCIGQGSLLLDLINSYSIPCIQLDIIHRQAQASGIVSTSANVRNKKPVVPFGFEGEKILGELKDLKLDISSEKESLPDKVVEYFKKELNKYKDIMQVAVITATTTRGNLSALNINKMIKNIYNPIKDGEEAYIEVSVDKNNSYLLSMGDKILVTKNNYKAKIYNETKKQFEEGAIYNGNVGIVTDIKENAIEADISGIGKVLIEDKHYNTIQLGYAITCHKCLTEDTYILTDTGLKQLKDIDNSSGYLGEYELDEIKVYNGEYLEKPSVFINAGEKDVLKITTRRGYDITGTLDHKIDVLSKDGYITKKEMKDIEIGDSLILAKNSNIFGCNTSFPEKCYITDNLDVRTKEYKCPKLLDEGISELLGMIVADGTVSRKRIKFSKRYEEVSLRFSEFIDKYFGYNVTPKLRKSGDYMCEISSTYIANFFMNIDGLQPHNKKIPQIILSSSEKNQCAFLKGFFEDGTVNIKKNTFDHIELTTGTDGFELIKQVQYLLLNMGIVSSYKKINHNKGYCKYVLYIYKDYANIFLDKIGFISKFKKDRLELCKDIKRSSSRITTPYIQTIMKDVCNELNRFDFPKRSLKLLVVTPVEKSHLTGVTKENIELFLSMFDDIPIGKNSKLDYLRFLSEKCYVDKVVSIEEDRKNTYCITMPETNSFIQNGFYGSNCQGSEYKSIIVAIDMSAYMLLSTEWLYTAITRAKQYCIIVADPQALNRACSHQLGNTKTTFLQEFLEIAK